MSVVVDKLAWKVAATLHFQAASESWLQSVPSPGHTGILRREARSRGAQTGQLSQGKASSRLCDLQESQGAYKKPQ